MRLPRALKAVALVGASAASIAASQAQEQTSPPEAASAAAQADPLFGDDIVVTAQKRSESVQKIPLAITAVGGEDLANRQVTSFESLAPSLPSVNFGKNVGFARIAIRGLGLDASVGGHEGRVAYHADGIYVGRPSSQLSTFFDISRVEVVRGPQGTLYGRNATAGAINVITNDPQDTFGGYAKLTVGNYGFFQEEGAVTGQVADGVAARFALTKTDRGGYGQNLVSGDDIDDEHSLAVRAKLKIEPSAGVTLLLSADYSYQDDAAFVYHFIGQGNPASQPRAVTLGGTVPADPRDTFADIPQTNERRNWGFGATLTVDIGQATLTSVTGYRDSLADVRGDHDGTRINVSTIQTLEQARQFSEELRLDGETGRLKWLIGGFYFNEKIYAQSKFGPVLAFNNAFLSRGLIFNGDLKTDAYAAFGQLDFEILDGLTLSAGLRYSHEKKFIDQRGAVELGMAATPGYTPGYTNFQKADVSFSSTTPRFNIQWSPTANLMFYATYAKGFKSGGFNLTGFAPAVRPEQLTDYEAGIKATLLSGAVRLNGSVFHYDYDDLQVQRILNAAAVVVNAATARVRGAEAEVTIRPVRGFELSGNVAYLDARFTSFASEDSARPTLGVLNLSGNRLPQAPEWTANLAAQYSLPVRSGTLRLRGEMAYTSQIFFSFYNRPEISQNGYAKYNGSVSYEASSGLTLSAWIKNIADRRTYSTTQVSSGFLGFPIMGTFDPPRTFGGSIGVSF
ncbi:TonB-dependent receptor [Sphingomonas sp. MG17]|uniref:TonB-dependent receptor n=1 Tax=Sphingomonas tagetis TaxID=2949092 RepID=A0A9X2HNN0_9SPHN|nr:TonB-dependent receptor [Sphingomonas tagetis]MCP3732614.1 TonB-dependent receptor [Sphingomonas tagetis]